MLQKPTIRLVVFDLDNTLTDTLAVWASGMAMVIRRMEGSLNVEREALRHAILRAKSQHRFGDYGGLSHHLKWKEKIPFHAQNSGEQYRIDAIRRNIRTEFFAIQRRNTVFYDGALETLTSIAATGAAQVIFSDTDAPSLIRRLWHLTQNSGIDFTDVFSAFYCMPSIEDDKNLLRDIDPEFVHKIKARLVVSLDGRRKIYPERLRAIMDDFDAGTEETLMIGDSDKDAGTALQADAHFAFYQTGALTSAETLEILLGYASPAYSYGQAAIIDKIGMVSQGKAYSVLSRLTEIFQSHSFAKAQSSCRHSPASEAIHIPLRLAGPDYIEPRLPLEYVRFGQSSHLRTTPPALPLSNFADKGDLEKPDPIGQILKEPIPA